MHNKVNKYFLLIDGDIINKIKDINNKITSDIHWDLEDAKGVVSNHVCYQAVQKEQNRSSEVKYLLTCTLGRKTPILYPLFTNVPPQISSIGKSNSILKKFCF